MSTGPTVCKVRVWLGDVGSCPLLFDLIKKKVIERR